MSKKLMLDINVYARALMNPLSGFGKHPGHTMAAYCDYELGKYAGQTKLRDEWVAILTAIVKSAPTFGSRGGKHPEVNASRIISCMNREQLFFEVS